ncbi:MAG: ester cyclase [Caldilineaceae bacterium]|nr:ester cyclase [Caldilineaceae bacterium]
MSNANKQLLVRFFEAIYNQGDLRVADEIVAVDYRNHNPAPGEAPGREGLKAFVAYLRRAFDDFHITVEDQVAAGDKVVTRFTINGRHVGEFAGIPPSGKFARVTAIGIHRVVDGRIVESWLSWDALGMMRQLGEKNEAALA